MIKIGFIVYNKKIGGAEKVTDTIIKGLNNEFIFKKIYLEDVECNQENEISLKINSVDGFLNSFVVTLLRCIKLKKIKEIEQFDIVVGTLPIINLINVLTNVGESDISTIHSYSDLNQNKLFNYMNRFIFKKSKKVIVISKMILEKCKKDYPKNKDKFKLLYNPINLKYIKKSFSETITTKSIINFIYAGKIAWNKGYVELLESFGKLLEDGFDNFKLTIIGRDLTKGDYLRIIHENKLESHIEYAGEVKNPIDYFMKSDVFVLPSYYEGYPNVLVEALSCGMPIISTNCKTGPSEILTDDEVCDDSLLTVCDVGILTLPVKYSKKIPFNKNEVVKQLNNAYKIMLQSDNLNYFLKNTTNRFYVLKNRSDISNYEMFFKEVGEKNE